MKIRCLSVALVAFTLPALAVAANDGKARQRRPQRAAAALADVLKPFDTNGNQKIEGDELAAVQKAFAALGKLDKNANRELEQGEIAAATTPGRRAQGGTLRERAAAGFNRVDANGNHRIDPDEIPVLEKMLANGPGEMLKKLDANSNGKLEESEIATLNERMARRGGARRPGAGPSSPSFRRPPEKPAESPKPTETIKPAEKSEKPAEAPKPETKKIEFGS